MQRNANPLLGWWQRLSRLPGGKLMFSVGIGRMARYTGSIRPRLLELGPGRAVVRMRDRPRVRNHLRSIHAVAILNLGEVTGGLAMLCALPEDARAILTRLSVVYLKKARGPLTATCDSDAPVGTGRFEREIESEIRDAEGDVVARVDACWLIDNGSE